MKHDSINSLHWKIEQKTRAFRIALHIASVYLNFELMKRKKVAHNVLQIAALLRM